MKILTFDIEEWFHILDNYSTKKELQWIKYEERIYRNMDKIFGLLHDNKLKATFFVVGWIAEKYPSIIKKIDNLGHEIGSHTHYHQLMYNQSKAQIEKDLKKSISTLENITGKKVKYFRAPGFSITEKNKWVFDILISNGITHDSSIFPANRAHGGFARFEETRPIIIEHNGLRIKEFPINTYNFFGKSFIFSGGGYFRIMPYYFIKKFSHKSDYVMTYFHPRDFDPAQPVIPELNLYRKFKSYVGLKSSLSKLYKWTSDFDFIDLKSADNLICWNKKAVVKL